MQKIEVIVRITKGHCPPQEQTIFEWIEMNRAAPDTLNYPGLEINLEHRRVFKNGQEVYMSRYEYGVLSLMARHPGQLFTKEQIFEAVWHQDSESCLTAVTNTIGRIVLYRSCGKSGITSSFPRFCPIVPIFAFPGRVIKKR